MNLITNKWIPVQKSITKTVIDITEIVGLDIIDLDFVRPDFNASIKNFLIGLLQTVFAPKTETEWLKLFKNRPSTKDLKKALAPLAEQFNLDGSPADPLFLQDLNLPQDCGTWPIQSLFIDGPKKKTITDGKDFFKRDGTLQNICPSCSAAFLYTLQTMAWTGGTGYYTSIRSGNSNILTMLAEGKDLWETLWLNVLPVSEINKLGTPGKVLFPWTVPYRSLASPKNSDPCHVYWEMPWRVRLVFEKKSVSCDCCGQVVPLVATKAKVISPGTKYADEWKHPLIPSREKPLYISDYAMRFPTVGSILLETNDCTAPYAIKTRQYKTILMYGASMDGAKYLCWLEKRIPQIDIPKATFEWMINTLNHFARNILDSTLRRCWQSKPTPSYGSLDTLLDSYFYKVVNDTDVKQLWFDALQINTLKLFDMETSLCSRKGLVRYNRRDLIEKIEAYAKKELLKFTVPSGATICFGRGHEQFQLSKAFCSSLMKWFCSLQHRKELKIELSAMEDLEEIHQHELRRDLFDRFCTCHPDEEDFITDNEALLDRVAVVTVLLCNLKESSKQSLSQYCRTQNHLEKKIQSVKNITTDWPKIRDIVRSTYSLDVIDLFKTIISWN